MRLFVIIIVIILTTITYFAPSLIKVKSIDCSGNFGACSPEISEALKQFGNQSLKKSSAQIKDYLKDQNSISDYDIRYTFPTDLKVYVVEQKPVFAVKIKESNNYLLLSSEGKVLNFAQDSPLPKASSDSELTDEELKFVSELGRKLFLIYSAKSSEIKNKAFIVGINEKYTVYFPLSGEIDVLIGSLELILSQLNKEGGSLKIENDKTISPSTIDLRYINPVLR